MMHLAGAVEKLILDQLFNNEPPAGSKSRISLGFIIISGFFAVCACVFFIVAAYIWLGDHYQPDLAAALTGVVALIVSLLFSLVALCLWCLERYRSKILQKRIMKVLRDVLAYVEENIKDPVEESPKTAVFAASMAGFSIGKKLL